MMGIAVRHLHKQYGAFTALDDVSVEVPNGSSSSSTRGSTARARANAMRCRWPPESWEG
jgi:hypothetical protein